MLHGGEDGVLGMDGMENENGGATARPEADAAAATKKAANQAVAALSRRVRGGDKASGTVAGYVRPGVDHLHKLREADELRVKSTEAVAQRRPQKVAKGPQTTNFGDGVKTYFLISKIRKF